MTISISSAQRSRQPFEDKALEYFAEVIINKSLIHEAGFGARAIPTYVGEWILSRYIEDGELSNQSRTNVAQFIPSPSLDHRGWHRCPRSSQHCLRPLAREAEIHP
jgi:hypothetical protein